MNSLNNKKQFTLPIDIPTDGIVIRGPGDQLIDEFKRVNPKAALGVETASASRLFCLE